MSYVISCSSTADLSLAYFQKRDIRVIYFHFSIDGVDYMDDCGISVSPEELFRRMDAGADTKTSQISPGEYREFWEPFLKEGKDVLHICLSSGISGTYNSAIIAQAELQEAYPDRKLYVVDSLAASSGFGLLVDDLADKRDAGWEIDRLHDWVEENKLHLHHWFFSTDLTYYIRGGRVTKTAGFVGRILNICPLLNVDKNGCLIPRENLRGENKALRRSLEMMEKHAADGTDYSGKCFISQSMCEDKAKRLAEMIEEHFPKLNGKVQIYPIGATIGSHTGPGTVALFFWGEERKD